MEKSLTLQIFISSQILLWKKNSKSLALINLLKKLERQLGVQLQDVQQSFNLMSNLITIVVRPVQNTTVSNANAYITLEWPVLSTKLTTPSAKMMPISFSSSRELSLNSVLSVIIGLKEQKVAQLWLANVVNSSAMSVEELHVLMECAQILQKKRLPKDQDQFQFFDDYGQDQQ